MKSLISIIRFKRLRLLHLACLLLLLGCFSCRKLVAVPPPSHEVGTSLVFNEEQTARAAIAGLYSQMMVATQSLTNGALSTYTALSADELYPTAPSTTLDPYYTNALTENDNFLRSRYWVKGYELIYQANACLQGLENSVSLSTALKTQLAGEVRLCRAFCYFYLVNLFGDVPLVLTTNYGESARQGRTPVMQVYQQILEDLLAARSVLSQADAPDRARPQYWAATAMLARVYLYLHDWEKAATEASAVINAGPYQLETDLQKVFLATSKETIWQLFPVLSTANTAEGNVFIPASAATRPTYALTPQLLAVFAEQDLRKKSWLNSHSIGNQQFHYPYKYKVRTAVSKTEYNVVLRLAEQYLIRAEARAHREELATALEDLNRIRRRAGLDDTTINATPALLDALQEERQRELFTEWGHRWLDLKRTGKADTILGALKNNWASYKALYPIPLTELLFNPSLKQNPGY